MELIADLEIRRLILRLKPNPMVAPKTGRGPGTDVALEELKVIPAKPSLFQTWAELSLSEAR